MEAARVRLLLALAAALLAACAEKSLDEQLIVAVRRNQPAEVDRLLAAGANASADQVKGFEGRPPLFHAATYGYVDIAQTLIDKGADVNAGARTGAVTALTAAALNGSAPLVALLLSKGAQVNARDGSGSTALTEAVRKGDPEVLRLLLQAGADPSVPMSDGSAPVCYARANNYKQAEQVLLAAGARSEC
jgi:ankyrin repeat protein